MKVLSFELDGRSTYGLLENDIVYEANDALRSRYPGLRDLLAGNSLADLPGNLDAHAHKERDVRYLPVILQPEKIICVGVNFRPHVEEMGRDIPEQPLLFVRFPGSLVGHREPIVRPAVSGQYDYEGELAVVIGTQARHVAAADALDCVAGYSCFMDGSVRDWQRHTTQFTAGKNFDRSGALGPYLLSRDEVPDPTALTLATQVNDEVRQEGRIGELIFDIPRLIAYCSTFAELQPGDIIATGTPGGVGAARTPPVWLQPGDRVRVDIGPLGTLENTVIAE